MDTSAVDFTALAVGVVAAAGVTAALLWGARGDRWSRLWATAAVAAGVLMAIGLADLLREQPRETHLATVLLGIPIGVLPAAGMVRATRRVRPWLRWLLVFATALVMLFVGLFLGAAIAPRYLGG